MPEVRPLINDGRRIEPAVSVNKITSGWKEVITIFYSHGTCIYRNGIYVFFTFDGEKRNRKIGVKDVEK